VGPDRLAGAILGEVEATLFENLYAAYHVDALRFARSLVGDPDMAADVVHSAYLEILRFLLSGRNWFDPAHAKSAVLRHTRWAAHNALRARRRLTDVELPGNIDAEADASTWAQAEARALCEFIVSQLHPKERAVIQARYVDDLSNAAAAASLGISEKAFETRLLRALASARQHAPQRRVGDAVEPTRRLAKFISFAAIGATLLAGAANFQEPKPSVARVASAIAPSVSSSTIVDAAAVTQPSGGIVVIALAEDRRCRCAEVLRSLDEGNSWQSGGSSTLPLTSGHLILSRDFPRDPRIFIAAPTGTFEAPMFGAPFARSSARPPATRDVSAGACRCPVGAPAESKPGVILPLTRDRTLLFPASGGVLCSRDGGRSWTVGCGHGSG
jgi:RNA polymerase sigma-70 factor (ECF subfamily)